MARDFVCPHCCTVYTGTHSLGDAVRCDRCFTAFTVLPFFGDQNSLLRLMGGAVFDMLAGRKCPACRVRDSSTSGPSMAPSGSSRAAGTTTGGAFTCVADATRRGTTRTLWRRDVTITIPRRGFNWASFTTALRAFAVTHGLEETCPIVDDSRAVSWQDHDELLEGRDDLQAVPGKPLDRLKAGFTLFASFTAYLGCRRVACADGSVIAVPDLEDDGVRPPLTDDARRLAEKTECDENHAYGFLISLNADRLTVLTALMSEANGECYVEAVVEAGLIEEPMAEFLATFVRRRGRRSVGTAD